jgi:hypothetical protein
MKYALPGQQRFAVLLLATSMCSGCQDARVDPLEKRVTHLEQSVEKLEAERNKRDKDDEDRRTKLENCVAQANSEFQQNLVSNGTHSRKGGYNVPVPVLNEMQKQKQSKMDECRLLYAK